MYDTIDYVVCLFDTVSYYVSFSSPILSWIMHVVKMFDNIIASIFFAGTKTL
jgi:hypothetical protein